MFMKYSGEEDERPIKPAKNAATTVLDIDEIPIRPKPIDDIPIRPVKKLA